MQVTGHKIDENGFYIEEVLVDKNNVIADVILEDWSNLIKPKWNGSQWIEGFEGELPAPTVPQPSEVEILAKQQTDLIFALMEKGVL